jgi:hypothetical protein
MSAWDPGWWLNYVFVPIAIASFAIYIAEPLKFLGRQIWAGLSRRRATKRAEDSRYVALLKENLVLLQVESTRCLSVELRGFALVIVSALLPVLYFVGKAVGGPQFTTVVPSLDVGVSVAIAGVTVGFLITMFAERWKTLLSLARKEHLPRAVVGRWGG